MKKLVTSNINNKSENNRNIIVEPTLEALQKQRNYHITEVEFHQSEITGLDLQIKKYKLLKENETVAENYNQHFKTKGILSLLSGIKQ